MPTASDLFEVPASPDTALIEAGEALRALGWMVTVGGDGVDALEDPATLSCRTSPSRMRIRIQAGPTGGSVLALEAEAPGVGPIPGPARLKRQIAALRHRLIPRDRARGAD